MLKYTAKSDLKNYHFYQLYFFELCYNQKTSSYFSNYVQYKTKPKVCGKNVYDLNTYRRQHQIL